MFAQPVAKPPYRDDTCDVESVFTDPYTALLARLKHDHVPYIMIWEMTHVCNLECVMCYNVPLGQPELSTQEGFDLLDQMAELGGLRLLLTGGEILSRRDFFPLAERARALGFALELKTNGTLITPERADRLAALNPTRVEISLLGATNRTFDAIAGRRNTLDKVVRGVRLLRERGILVKLNTVLMDLNVAEQRQMAGLAAELGAQHQQSAKVHRADDGADKAGRHQLNSQQIAAVIAADGVAVVRKPKTPETRTCGVGLASLTVSPYGEVYPCVELRVSAGNVRRQPLAEIWREGPIFRRLRERHMVKNLPECRVCPINSYCQARCSGLSLKESGDLYLGHSQACLQAQAQFALLNPGEPVPETPVLARLRSREHIPVAAPATAMPIPLLDVTYPAAGGAVALHSS